MFRVRPTSSDVVMGAELLAILPAEPIAGGSSDPSILSIARNVSELTITWTQSGVLESSPNVNGPYQAVTGAPSSPHTVDPSASAGFYRVRNP